MIDRFKIGTLLFEKVELAKRENPNNKQQYPQWNQMNVGHSNFIESKLKECLQSFRNRGPLGLLKVFFEEDDVDMICQNNSRST